MTTSHDDDLEGWHLTIARMDRRYRILITNPDRQQIEYELASDSLSQVDTIFELERRMWRTRKDQQKSG